MQILTEKHWPSSVGSHTVGCKFKFPQYSQDTQWWMINMSLVLVQAPALTLPPLDTRHLYSSLQRRSSWPAHVSKLVKISDNELRCFLLPSRIPLLTPIVTNSGFSIHDGTLLHSKSQYTTVKHSRQLSEHKYTSYLFVFQAYTALSIAILLWKPITACLHCCVCFTVACVVETFVFIVALCCLTCDIIIYHLSKEILLQYLKTVTRNG
jgi:hypothetical protein